MHKDLNIFKTSFAMATHAGKRQAVISQNIANADTPGYRARDITPFVSAFEDIGSTPGLRITRQGHLNREQMSWQEFVAGGASDPNGNSVSVELEVLKAVEARRQHNRALAIYKSSLSILRTSLGRA